jgi:hypothetical protein
MRYGTRFGCRFGQPHDFIILRDMPTAKYERCIICGARKRWNKGYKGRIENVEYLKAHVRQYAQAGGPTKRIFMKLYKPERCVITI